MIIFWNQKIPGHMGSPGREALDNSAASLSKAQSSKEGEAEGWYTRELPRILVCTGHPGTLKRQ